MTPPKVSVVTVCYNCDKLLQKTITNVLRQTYKNLEYIIIDGASTDSTAQVIETFRPHLTTVVSEPDRGIYDAMNKGVRLATGEWVIFMNAGDGFAADDVLQRVFAEERAADVIYGDVVKRGVIKKAEAPHNGHRMFFCHQSALTRTSCLHEYPFDIRHRMSADFKLFKQLFLAGKRFLQLDFPIADFDVTGVSNSLRSAGLKDNICVISEVDSLKERLRLLPRLYFVYFMCRLRGR